MSPEGIPLSTSALADRVRRSPARRLVYRWRHRGLTDADVMLASYPRSGNTWMKFMLAELLAGQEIDFNNNEDIVPMVGSHSGAPALLPGGGRLIKTHEPYSPAYGRAVYLLRDVRDVALSFRNLRGARGFGDEPLDTFLPNFVAGKVGGYGTWENHVTSWLTAAEGDSRIFVLRYEDLFDDTVLHLGRVASFLEVESTPEQIEVIAANNRPARMRARRGSLSADRVAATVREGGYERWRGKYSPAQLDLLTDASQEAMALAGYLPSGDR
jgi:Sulfotransferase domain